MYRGLFRRAARNAHPAIHPPRSQSHPIGPTMGGPWQLQNVAQLPRRTTTQDADSTRPCNLMDPTIPQPYGHPCSRPCNLVDIHAPVFHMTEPRLHPTDGADPESKLRSVSRRGRHTHRLSALPRFESWCERMLIRIDIPPKKIVIRNKILMSAAEREIARLRQYYQEVDDHTLEASPIRKGSPGRSKPSGKKKNYVAVSTPIPNKTNRGSLSLRVRRQSMYDTPGARMVWEDVNAHLCQHMTPSNTEFEFSTTMNFNKIAENFDTIFTRMLGGFTTAFPNVLFSELKLQAKLPRRGKVVSRQSQRSPKPASRFTRGSGSRRPVGKKPMPPAPCVYDFMGITRTEREWDSKTPLTELEERRLEPLLHNITTCTRTAERFGVFVLSWKMLSKEKTRSGNEQYIGHIMPLVIDTEPTEGTRKLSVMVIDINGVGLAKNRYNAIDSTQRPTGGPNRLLQRVLSVVIKSVADGMGIAEWSVVFPTFANINLSDDDNETASNGDAAYPQLANARFTGMNDGICSIATLFVIMRLICDQRRVLMTPLDATINRFIKDTSSYEHILFVRSFIYRLMAYFGLNKPTYGIGGDTVTVNR